MPISRQEVAERINSQYPYRKLLKADVQRIVHPVPIEPVRRKYYFLDESGNIELFDRKHRNIVGRQGCSRFSMLGMVDVSDPLLLDAQMFELRSALLADPRFHHDPTFSKRHAHLFDQFHASDDPPEVRERVFSFLMAQDLKFFAVVTDKECTVKRVRDRIAQEPQYRFNLNEEYDFLVRCMFNGRLHKEPHYVIRFAHRGTADRTKILETALLSKRGWYLQHYGIKDDGCHLEVSGHRPSEFAGLQAADYFLWALQRFYHRKEADYLDLIWDKCALINDRDVPGIGISGSYYCRKKPLTLAALKEARGI